MRQSHFEGVATTNSTSYNVKDANSAATPSHNDHVPFLLPFRILSAALTKTVLSLLLLQPLLTGFPTFVPIRREAFYPG